MRNMLSFVLVFVLMMAIPAESVQGWQDGSMSSKQRAVAGSSVDSAAQSQDTTPPPEIIFLGKGTHMCLFPERAVATRSAKPGDKITFHVGTNIDVNGMTLIAQGTEVPGVVTEALRPGIGRKDGRLSFAFGPVPLLGGEVLPIQPAKPIIAPKPRKAKRPIAKTVLELLDDP